MINVTIKNTNEVLEAISNALGAVLNTDNMLRTVATSMLPEVRHRIHVSGQAADGSPISNRGYSDGYLEMREKNNRGRDRKVILSLTRTMENQFAALPSADGDSWGLGFRNSPRPNNAQTYAELAIHFEQLYGKKIYSLTAEEEVQAETIINSFIEEAFDAVR